MPRVILFRTPTPGDVYASEFNARGYTTTSIPALDDQLRPEALSPHLDPERWEGVVITSRRAAEAWVQANQANDSTPDWSDVPFYAPGGAVGSVISALPDPPAPITAISAAALTPLILERPPRDSASYRPYLLLVGDKSLPTIPEALDSAGRKYTRVQVYQTCEASSLQGDIARLTLETGDWVALFSPSSAACVLKYLDVEGGVRIAAIGETTARALPSVDAVARTPDAEGLAEAIASADR